ncbi:YsnF/AvaK domain-containing protein [Psychrobacter sp. I-STPA10]|uniref:YsnF/AvaK domain-containing protein n=1 Tax=Psychrobacter sp. I-STPA10 TaxID=2585769 RepID=UPI001E4530C3|nr:DUF2382 domain-containing protein [Psychrobacter sp. I-STPA10]
MNTPNQDALSTKVQDTSVQDDQLTPNSIATQSTDKPVKQQQVGKLELLEERAVVHKERLDVGKIIATKHIRTKTVNVPIELIEEVLTVTTTYEDVDSQSLLQGDYDDKEVIRHVEPVLDSTASVTINGHRVEVGEEPIEIVLSRQVAIISKETHIVQEVEIEKTTHTHKDSISVELKREELDIKEEGFLSHGKQD